jgi:hypothetical protein
MDQPGHCGGFGAAWWSLCWSHYRVNGTDLQVIASSGEGKERKHAAKVLGLLGRGKHWVLVTLLLSNVITNETLPIVLDRSLGGGWAAVVSSTVLIGKFVVEVENKQYGRLPQPQSSSVKSLPNRSVYDTGCLSVLSCRHSCLS